MPCLTCAASSCDPAKEKSILTPGCSFSYAFPACSNTSVSEAAASTVSWVFFFSDPAEAEPSPPFSPSPAAGGERYQHGGGGDRQQGAAG